MKTGIIYSVSVCQWGGGDSGGREQDLKWKRIRPVEGVKTSQSYIPPRDCNISSFINNPTNQYWIRKCKNSSPSEDRFVLCIQTLLCLYCHTKYGIFTYEVVYLCLPHFWSCVYLYVNKYNEMTTISRSINALKLHRAYSVIIELSLNHQMDQTKEHFITTDQRPFHHYRTDQRPFQNYRPKTISLLQTKDNFITTDQRPFHHYRPKTISSLQTKEHFIATDQRPFHHYRTDQRPFH